MAIRRKIITTVAIMAAAGMVIKKIMNRKGQEKCHAILIMII
jgi:hypothetical protein